jgi:hypothetical protein
LDIALEGTGVLEAVWHLNVKVVSFHGGLGEKNKTYWKRLPLKFLSRMTICICREITAFQQKCVTQNGLANDLLCKRSSRFYQSEYGNDNSKGAAYNATAARRSFEHLKLFLNEVLKIDILSKACN